MAKCERAQWRAKGGNGTIQREIEGDSCDRPCSPAVATGAQSVASAGQRRGAERKTARNWCTTWRPPEDGRPRVCHLLRRSGQSTRKTRARPESPYTGNGCVRGTEKGRSTRKTRDVRANGVGKELAQLVWRPLDDRKILLAKFLLEKGDALLAAIPRGLVGPGRRGRRGCLSRPLARRRNATSWRVKRRRRGRQGRRTGMRRLERDALVVGQLIVVFFLCQSCTLRRVAVALLLRRSLHIHTLQPKYGSGTRPLLTRE